MIWLNNCLLHFLGRVGRGRALVALQPLLDPLARADAYLCLLVLNEVSRLHCVLRRVEVQTALDLAVLRRSDLDIENVVDSLELELVNWNLLEVLNAHLGFQVPANYLLIRKIGLKETQPDVVCHHHELHYNLRLRHVLNIFEVQVMSTSFRVDLNNAVLVLSVFWKVDRLILNPERGQWSVFVQWLQVHWQFKPSPDDEEHFKKIRFHSNR